MSNTNFQDILNKNADDIHPPPVLPEGSYHTVVIGLPESGESSKKKTPQLKFTHKIIGPLEDVDPDQIAEFEAEGETVAGQEVENIHYVTLKTQNMIKEFLINCGIDMTGKSLAEGIDETPNSEVIVFMQHEQSKDGKKTYSKVRYTAKIPD